MKKTIPAFLLSLLLFSINSTAQNWLTTGNALGANGTLGSTTNFSVVFKSNNSERGRLTNAGLWGFGTTAPNSKVHINSASGQIPLRVQVNASTKFLVHSGGGVSIGSSSTPPANGLFVSGNVGIGTTSPSSKLQVAGSIIGFDSYFNSTSGFHGISLGRSGGSYGSIGYGLTFTGTTNTYQYRVSDFSSMINFNGGGFEFNTAPSGTTGTSIPYTAVMTILQNGNVGIGANPGFHKLKIFGGMDLESNSGNGEDWSLFTSSNGNLYLFFNEFERGHFNTTTGAYSSVSDERLKTNIKPMAALLDKINQLKPSTYQFKNAADKQEYNGFIAQDVLKIFPSLVSHNINKERNLDVYSMDYSGFGVIAIKGIQELQPIVEEQKEKIVALEERILKLEAALASITANDNGNIYNGLLEQNKPNPFNKNTTIRYSIPQGSKGQINIYDQAGKLVKTINANAGGQSQVSAHELAAGAYTYTLMINGKVSLSKQMLIVK